MNTSAFARSSHPSAAVGYIGGTVTVLIWAGWVLATRHSAATPLGTIDIGLIRYGVPVLALSPVWWRVGLLPKGVPLHLLALMVAGSGALFFQLTTFAIHATPAASAGILLGGSMPLAAAVIGVTVFRERLDMSRWIGLAAILAGAGILLAGSLSNRGIPWTSFLLLPLSALLWASYTHAFKRSGLTAVEAGAVIALWSFLIHIGLALVYGTALGLASAGEIALQVMSQGILSGLMAVLAYGIAVRALGGTQAAAFTAITPVLVTLGGGLLLGETVGLVEISAAALTGIGVALSTGLFSKRR
ncbi:MAG TPA: DMT family transporter [Pararhizobium sp.]|uniref:DMT family transporter n=1 Tax=Pararhizobium sp. TaxID=1977563 RepID=UPI002D138762|nr:DMT family transporter [Pararhizobium sp.]HTO30801.1 DMT family transporter [Pararhizobium sp.]